jgi:hypothetical protein
MRYLVATVALVVSVVIIAEAGTPTKGTLPKYWKGLGLSDAQRAEVYKITGEYGKKIADLKAQIKAAEAEEKTKLYAVLTDAQKEQLKKILAEKAGATEPAKDKPPAKDK